MPLANCHSSPVNRTRVAVIGAGMAGVLSAIKLTEACIREYQDTLDPGYLFVAEDVVPHIRATDSTPGG